MPVKSLHAAYIDGDAALQPFFAGNFRDAANQKPAVHSWAGGLRDGLAAYQTAIGNVASPPADAVIITGQQPGLFTGPLYTVYKIATAIRLASDVAATTGITCSPIFWLGSDDHDFDEARTAHVLTKNHEPRELTYNPSTDVAGLPLYRVPLDESLHSLVDVAAESTAGSEFRNEVREFLHESVDTSTTFSEWTARILARLFHGLNVCILTSELPPVRDAARAVFEREIREPLLSTRLVNEQGARLQALGFEQQVSKGANECGFFLDVDGKRCKVTYAGGVFTVNTSGVKYSSSELLSILNEHPQQYSPNVALRCIVQQTLFPVHAYVAGPGEIAYWAQFKPLFDHFGLPMPIVYPRASCVLTTPKLKKLCGKYGLDARTLTGSDPAALLNDALRTSNSNPHYTAFVRERATIEQSLSALDTSLANAPVPASALRGRIDADLDWYERSLLRADESRVDATRQQVDRLCNAFAPWRKPQERVYTIVSYLFEHGWNLVPRIVREIDHRSFGVNEIEL